MKIFNTNLLSYLYKPPRISYGEDNGQVTIIGGSSLFHGAPLLSLKVASRIVDMVFFASPEPSLGRLAEQIKSKLFSFIWVPWEEVEEYIAKSDAVLIGPGFMRFHSEGIPQAKRHFVCDVACQRTRKITESLLSKFKSQRWVIDAGSLQAIDPELLPKGCVITPNRKEFELLFSVKLEDRRLRSEKKDRSGKVEGRNRTSRLKFQPSLSNLKHQTSDFNLVRRMSDKYHCSIVLKGPETIVCSPDEYVLVKGGNPGLTKGGTGDVQAGLTVALLAKNEPFLAAASASYIIKKAADELYKKVGLNYNADDLADKIPETFRRAISER